MDARTRWDWIAEVMPVTLSEASGAGVAAGSDSGLTYAVTTDFSEEDTGVVRADDHAVDLRTEILTVTTAGADVASVVLRAAATQLGADSAFPAQPGTVLPGLAVRANLDFVEFSVRHGLLVSPLLWGGPVPQYVEPEDNRMTLMLELILLRKDEYEAVQEHGVDPLLRRAAGEGVDLHDWSRGPWL